MTKTTKLLAIFLILSFLIFECACSFGAQKAGKTERENPSGGLPVRRRADACGLSADDYGVDMGSDGLRAGLCAVCGRAAVRPLQGGQLRGEETLPSAEIGRTHPCGHGRGHVFPKA